MKMYEYYKTNSCIHNLNPLIKIFWLFILSIIILTSNNIIFLSGIFIFMFLSQLITKIPLKIFFEYTKEVVIFIILISIIIVVTNSYMIGILFFIKLYIIIVSAVQFTLTTTKKELMIALIKLKVPYSFAYSLTIAFRFLPLIIKEFKEVSNAQKIRGHKIKFNILHPIKSSQTFIPIITPLLIILFGKSLELAIASDSRGFTPTVYAQQKLKFQLKDFVATAILILIILISLVL